MHDSRYNCYNSVIKHNNHHQANYNLITQNNLFPPEVDSVRAGAGPQSEVVFVVWFIPRLTQQVPALGPITASVITNHLGDRPADSLRHLLTTQTDHHPLHDLRCHSPW